jgi:glutathione S-transferase
VILIGQYDSPFVRRVGVALHLYGIAYEHRPWSVFGDAARLQAINPLGRVPTLVLEDGTALLESAAILDYLDDQVGDRALVPRSGPARMMALRRTALAIGLAEKSVALVYEAKFHSPPAAFAIARIEGQIERALAALALDCAAAAPFWHGATPGHADIALACAVHFVAEVHPHLARPDAVMAHGARCEALPVFGLVRQDFAPP